LVQGERSRGDRNQHIGSIVIPTNKIRRDLDAGTVVAVTIHLQASRAAFAEAYIAVLDETFEQELELVLSPPNMDSLHKIYCAETERVVSLSQQIDKLCTCDHNEAQKAEQIKSGLASLGAVIPNCRLLAQNANEDALYQLEEKILDYQSQVDMLEDITNWLHSVSKAKEAITNALYYANLHGDGAAKQQATELQGALEAALLSHSQGKLGSITLEANGLWETLYFADPDRVESYIQKLGEQYQGSRDQFTEEQRDDVEKIRQAVHSAPQERRKDMMYKLHNLISNTLNQPEPNRDSGLAERCGLTRHEERP
jgi:hypothetical protein